MSALKSFQKGAIWSTPGAFGVSDTLGLIVLPLSSDARFRPLDVALSGGSHPALGGLLLSLYIDVRYLSFPFLPTCVVAFVLANSAYSEMLPP